jgi:hypothetical protein
MNINSRFARACDQRSMTVDRLSRLAGISSAYAQQLRAGRVPSRAVRARVALVMGLHVTELWPDVVDEPEVA